jgi:hypothetical protein
MVYERTEEGYVMNVEEPDPELLDLLSSAENGIPSTGTVDDDDEPEDEREDENEAPMRESSDATEAPEEFEVDDED